jgi:vacuolar-type H+-ATPase subunit H
MLGADNLSDSVVKAFQRMLGSGNTNRNLDESEVDALRAEIKRFTVRRTKKQLNRLIDAAPENYTDFKGRQCRFPKHQAKVYSLEESVADRKIAARITELSEQLYGVTHFIKAVRMPDQFVRQGVSEEAFLQGRLLSAKKLVAYTIRAALRSSRAALIEHICGTESAIKFAGLTDFNKGQSSDGMLTRITTIREILPENRLSIPLPDWLSDKAEHTSACVHDEQIYRQIAALAEQMSDQRERNKVFKLIALLREHNLVLAFDRSPITLAMFAQRLKVEKTVKVLTAWGGGSSDRRKVLDNFALGSTEKGVVGLCSDSLAEAVNLQQASCLVHLDMPSVVRVAEQRVGRIDRMDSPHRQIEIWWPDDSPEFALRADEKFIERYETVERLLGANMPLPEHMLNPNKQSVSVQSMIKEAESVEVEWDGIVDAFAPVRELIEGERALVSAADYAHYAHVTARIMSRVSLVKARSPWALFCLTTGTFGAPVWVYLGRKNAVAETGFEKITEKLRKRLDNLVEDAPMNAHGAKVLEQFLTQLSECERQLLSRKKQKALTEMEAILQKLLQKTNEQHEIDQLLKLLSVLQRPERDIQPDWDEIALRWLDLIRPVWFEQLSQKRNRPLLLKDIRSALLHNPQTLIADIISQFGTLPILTPAHERIKACIIGL